jgi:hypothetical protein
VEDIYRIGSRDEMATGSPGTLFVTASRWIGRESAMSTTESPVVDPADLPLDQPQGPDGDDRGNDLPDEAEKP